MNSALQNAHTQLGRACAIAGIDDKTLDILKKPRNVIEFDMPVQMDDGQVKIFKGFRVQHNNARGPHKGGIRFHPQVTLEEVSALATWMTLKCAVLEIPLGGGKGGVIVDPKTLSLAELQKLSRSYIRQIAHSIGPDIDVPAPDVNTNSQVMAWMLDEYETIIGHHAPAVITGKPLQLGGANGREKATAMGGVFALLEALHVLDIKGRTIAIQGIGNVGGNLAKLLEERGFKIVAISDSQGGVYDEKGLNISDLFAYKKEKGSLKGYPNAKPISASELLELPVSILAPAALENQITRENAKNIKARLILELANGPTTPEADAILFENEITIVPDILANAGGVVVSYFEWIQNREGGQKTLEEINKMLGQKMSKAFLDTYAFAKEKKIDMRTAAQALALERVVYAMRLRGQL